jgi:hypothetical protein
MHVMKHTKRANQETAPKQKHDESCWVTAYNQAVGVMRLCAVTK